MRKIMNGTRTHARPNLRTVAARQKLLKQFFLTKAYQKR